MWAYVNDLIHQHITYFLDLSSVSCLTFTNNLLSNLNYDHISMAAVTPILPTSFLEAAKSVDASSRLRWYMCVVVMLSSVNYPDVIPQVYEHLDRNLLSKLSEEDRFNAVRKLREGLIKSTGIVGAARTGNAIRTLAGCIPVALREKESPRSQESDEKARERGKAFWTRIYSRNKAFDPEATVRASPDYAFIVRGSLSHFSLEMKNHVKSSLFDRGLVRSDLLIRWSY